MAYDFSKGSKTIRKVGFLDGVSGSKIRPVSPFPLESSKGLVAKYFDSTKESLSATRLLDQSPLNSGTRRTGEEGRCYLYDGVNDYSTLDAGFTASGDFTLSFNINATSFASPFHVFIASTTSDRIYFNNGISFNIIANGTLSIFTLDKTLVAGAWYNILVRRVSGTITVYVDGVAQSDTEANAQDLDFLYLSSSTIGLNANIFDVRYFNSAITDPQLNYVVSFGRTGTPVTPTNWWKCDEQSGTVGYDSVGGNHLTHNNITAGTFHATQDIWSFQNQVGAGNYLYGNNVSSVATITNTSNLLLGVADFEISFGFFYNQAGVICEKGGTANTSYIFAVNELAWVGGTSNKLVFWTNGGSGNLYSVTDVTDGNYYQVKVTRVSNDFYLYINGVLEDTASAASFNQTDTSNITLLRSNGNARHFGGGIRNFKIIKNNETIGDLLCDEGFGNVCIDSSGYNHNAVLSNTSWLRIPRDKSDPTNDVLGNPLTNTGRRPNDAALHSSNCLTLNGTNQAVRVADNAAFDWSTALSGGAWVKNNNSNLTLYEAIISKHDFGNNRREIAFIFDPNEKLALTLGSSDGSSFSTETSNIALTTNVWNHVFFTYNSGTVNLYVNGYNVASTTTSGTHVPTLNNEDADLMIGSVLNNDANSNQWDGQILDPRIYKRVLTPAEILSIYQDARNLKDDATLIRFPLQEGGGIIVHDVGPNELKGTIENAATNWSVTQDLVHSNLSYGFVYAYQPAKQVFTGAQAANITGISFKFRSTDTALVLFNDGSGLPYLLIASVSDGASSIYTNSGTPVIEIDGGVYVGANRIDLRNAICDGEVHEIIISGISFSSGWLTGGVYINSYAGWDWNSTTYLWDLQATDSNGDPIYPADPDVRLPAVTSSLGPYSIPLTDLPSNSYRNRAETLIDLDPDSTPEMNNIYLESVFNGSTSNGYVTNDSILNFTDNLTVSCWAKSDLTDITSSADTLVSMYESTGNLQVWRMEISTDEKLRFQVGNSGGNGTTIETADSSYPIDTWTHYAATFDGGVVKLYVNGELQSSSESSAHATSLNGRSSPLVLGAYYWSGGGGSFQEWDGALRNIRVYKGDSAPLSNSQIVRDMMETASQPRFEGQTVIASYDLVKDTLDRSGNSLNAQNNNISFTKKTVPASLDLGTDLGEDGIVQKTVKFDSGEWGAVFDGSSYMIVKNREKLKIKEKPFSIECSVKTSDTGSNTILSKYQTSGNLRSYSLNIESGKIVFHSSSNGTAVVSSTGSDTINDGSWHKIKVVRESESGTSLKMYVDDVEDTGVGGSLASNFSENISNVAIGAYNTDATAANVFTGNIRELKVFTDDNIERASWELAKDTRDSSSNNYHGENNGITFLTPKQEYGYTVSDSTPLAKQDQYLKEYHKSRLFL